MNRLSFALHTHVICLSRRSRLWKGLRASVEIFIQNMPGGNVCVGISLTSCKGLEFEGCKTSIPAETLQDEALLHRKRKLIENGDLSLRWGQRKRSRFAKATAVDTACEALNAKTSDQLPAAVESTVSSMQRSPALDSRDAGLKGCSPSEQKLEPRLHLDKNADNPPVGNIAGSSLKRRPLSHERSDKVPDPSRTLANNRHKNAPIHRRTEVESLHDKPVMLGKLNLDLFKWPKILISLSHKEKEDDFMAIKGSKLPQRPKRRAKHIEKSVSYVSPGTWLCELTRDRYEVRERKSLRKKPRGLKAMGSLDSDSE